MRKEILALVLVLLLSSIIFADSVGGDGGDGGEDFDGSDDYDGNDINNSQKHEEFLGNSEIAILKIGVIISVFSFFVAYICLLGPLMAILCIGIIWTPLIFVILLIMAIFYRKVSENLQKLYEFHLYFTASFIPFSVPMIAILWIVLLSFTYICSCINRPVWLYGLPFFCVICYLLWKISKMFHNPRRFNARISDTEKQKIIDNSLSAEVPNEIRAFNMCRKQHLLNFTSQDYNSKFSSNARQKCNGCGELYLLRTGAYRCNKCDFDICTTCKNISVNYDLKYPICKQGHILVKSSYFGNNEFMPYNDKEYQCRVCLKIKSCELKRYFCPYCLIDVCEECQKK